MNTLYTKPILPMLLKSVSKPFDDANYIFELKLDGIRCIVFCTDKTILQSRNLKNLSKTYPELNLLHKQCKKNCILDGEIIYADENGFPNFGFLQKRNLLVEKANIEKQAQNYPVSLVAFDILALDNKKLMDLTLMERKEILKNNIKENEFLSVARHIDNNGIDFFNKIKEMSLEGIVAKRKDSTYIIGKRSSNWLKIKNILSEDYIICGYLPDKTGEVKSLILARKENGELIFDGEIYVPSNETKEFVFNYAKKHKNKTIFENLKSNIVWIKPNLICRVDFAERTQNGERRQPIFRGIRTD